MSNWLQTFATLIVGRFQNINPNKDGNNVKGPADIKYEMKVMTLPDDHYAMWEEFLTKHSNGDLINPETLQPYRQAKGVKKRFTLQREFFKHLGRFTDEDLKAYVQHLLGRTPNRSLPYPKVSVGKTKSYVVGHYSGHDWVECRKRKKIILEEFMNIDKNLSFFTPDGAVDKDSWKAWKKKYRFSTATFDFLLSTPSADFFKKRLTNEAVNKRLSDMTDKFDELNDMLKTFLSHKYRLQEPAGKIQLRGHDATSMAFRVRNSKWRYNARKGLSFGIADFREAPKHKPSPDPLAPAPLFPFLTKLLELDDPPMTKPSVWLWITASPLDGDTASAFIASYYKDYEYEASLYKPCKAERLNDVTTRQTAPDVTLHFMFKRHVPNYIRGLLKKEYSASPILYYNDPSKNHEAKWRLHPSELRMEFYFELLQNFASPGENFFGIYTGAKCMLAAKVMFESIWFQCESNGDRRVDDAHCSKLLQSSGDSYL